MLLVAVVFTSCQDYETYGDKKAKERDAIERYISGHNIRVISESTFKAQGETTNLADNEFVKLDRTGVYMQIVRKGCGSQLENNKTVNVLCRFMEYNILDDSVMVRNDCNFYIYNSSTGTINCADFVDKMSVTRTGTSYTASFITGVLWMFHGSSTSVPSGWLVPLNYINVGRPENDGDELAMVKLIVPHSQGTADAASSVYPCYYEITYEREK
jgi:hypothetical protein